MRGKNLLLALTFIYFSINSLSAQVGINTMNPLANSVLHIKSDKSTSEGSENDLIVDRSTGYIGLGTSTPTTQLDVKGSFRFEDKSSTDFSNNILTSDSEGNASWKNFNKTVHYKKASWNLENNSYPDITASNNIIKVTGTTEFTSTIKDASVTDDSLILPKGRYYITITSGLSNATSKYIYQIIKVLNGNNMILESYFFNTTTSAGLFLDIKETATLSIQIDVPDVRSDASKTLAIADALPLVGPNKVWAKVNVLTLDIQE